MLPESKDSIYTSNYCEENVYLLVQRFLAQPEINEKWGVYTVFISNRTKTVTLWQQKAATSRDQAVIWDYHVILALRGSLDNGCDQSLDEVTPARGTWIYDLDTLLPVPCYWKKYIEQTFPIHINLPDQFQSIFRVVPGKEYLNNFASDRSHMVVSGPSHGPHYASKPPPYPCISGPLAAANGVTHNLMSHFVEMDVDIERFGSVMDFESFLAWCSE
ncbi:N-terminal glutamine amidase-domain-containing protein [Scleroderma yunnanense]